VLFTEIELSKMNQTHISRTSYLFL